jgi:hypothetical protein
MAAGKEQEIIMVYDSEIREEEEKISETTKKMTCGEKYRSRPN